MFFIQNMWLPLFSNMNNIPFVSARDARFIRPVVICSGVLASSTSMHESLKQTLSWSSLLDVVDMNIRAMAIMAVAASILNDGFLVFIFGYDLSVKYIYGFFQYVSVVCMAKRKGMNVFNVFVAFLVLIPSALLLYMYKGEISKVCVSSDIVLYTVIASCAVLLSGMMIFRELLLGE